MSVVRGCLAQLGCLTVVLVVGVAAWLFRDTATGAVRRWMGKSAEWNSMVIRVEPQLADSVERKIARLRSGGEAAFTMSEVQSWVTYRLEPTLPSYVYDVRVTLLESALRLDAKVWPKQIPGVEAVGPILQVVGDTAEVSALGPVDGIGKGRGAYFVEQMFVNGVPLPDPVRDRILEPMGAGRDGLPAHAIPFLLPTPAWDVAVRGGVLVLRAPTPRRGAAPEPEARSRRLATTR